MNQELSNQEFEVKRNKIKNDSMFKSSRQLASDFEKWDPTSIEKRSNTIAEWAIKMGDMNLFIT